MFSSLDSFTWKDFTLGVMASSCFAMALQRLQTSTKQWVSIIYQTCYILKLNFKNGN